MNLRNKKTGKLYEWCSIMVKKNRKSVKLLVAEKEDCKFIVEDDGETYYYESFEKMCEEWETVEDPQPKEPLIEDDKARKVFREWADLIGEKCFRVEHRCKYGRTIITSTDLTAEPVIELPGYIGEDLKIYTKIELVGDEIE